MLVSTINFKEVYSLKKHIKIYNKLVFLYTICGIFAL